MSRRLGAGTITFFTRHKVAANLLMLMMILGGVWALLHLNTQFFPTFSLQYVTVNVEWPSASAEDVENSIINPLEIELRSVDHVKKMFASATIGNARIVMEFKQSTDMGRALEQVKEKVSLVRNLPEESREPIIVRVENFEPVAKLLITGSTLRELRPFIFKFERELLDRGIAKTDIFGLPEQEIAIQVPTAKLVEFNRSLVDVANKINELSKDIPAGIVGRGQYAQQLRSLEQGRSIKDFEALPLYTDQTGRIIRLKDIADVQLQDRENEVRVYDNGKSAVVMQLFRTENTDSLKSAKILQSWLQNVRKQLPPSIQIKPYDQTWNAIKERINLLLFNGGGGLILIIIVLLIFLSLRIAWWTSAGIAISFLAALSLLYLFNSSINMISLFAFIMGLGIVIDDTIVVSEETQSQYQQGQDPVRSAEIGALRMLRPIIAASLTTVCAFIPLLLIGDNIGQILRDIPIVIISLIIASVIECFLILPNHLSISLQHSKKQTNGKFRLWFDSKFATFRDGFFRKVVTLAIEFRWVTIASALGILIITIGIVASGYINFNFFLNPEGRMIQANAKFVAGTPPAEVRNFSHTLEKTFYKTLAEFNKKEGKNILSAAVSYENLAPSTSFNDPATKNKGEEYTSLQVEFISPDKRDTLNKDFINAWRKNVKLPPGIENFTIIKRQVGLPGKDIDINITGSNLQNIKSASNGLIQALQTFEGVSDVEDNLPYGQNQLVFDLTHEGEALGLTIADVAKQIRAAYSGSVAQIYHSTNEEIEVRVMLPEAERHSLAKLRELPIITKDKHAVPLGTVVRLISQTGFDIIRHTNTKLSVNIMAEVDSDITNTNKIFTSLRANTLPQLEKKYNVRFNFEGKNEEQKGTIKDMEYGGLLAIILIFIILAWTFSSYTLPIIVMLAIPLGITGAILGHLIMHLDITILSLFGILGLTGIIVNDSIILMIRYTELRGKDMSVHDAIVGAACQRLRAVLLTSITTIVGLTPLLFERSLQAQFLIPMATSIAFGLAYGTLLILLVIPASLVAFESFKHKNTNDI